MGNIKYRQRNKNNGHYHYWGKIDGIWVSPIFQDNYEPPNESDIFINILDDDGKEIYVGDKVHIKFPYIWGDLFEREGTVKYSQKNARFYIDLEEEVDYFCELGFNDDEIPINNIKIID